MQKVFFLQNSGSREFRNATFHSSAIRRRFSVSRSRVYLRNCDTSPTERLVVHARLSGAGNVDARRNLRHLTKRWSQRRDCVRVLPWVSSFMGSLSVVAQLCRSAASNAGGFEQEPTEGTETDSILCF